MRTMKRALALALTLTLVLALLPVPASAEPSFDSSETICLYVGQKLEYQRPEPFALDYAALTAYFKSDEYCARAYATEVIFGEEEKLLATARFSYFCVDGSEIAQNSRAARQP